MWVKLLKQASSDTLRVDNKEASSTQSRGRNSKPWILATRRSPSHLPRVVFTSNKKATLTSSQGSLAFLLLVKSQSRWAIRPGGAHEVLPDDCAPLALEHKMDSSAKQGLCSALPFKGHHTTRYAIPQGCPVHPGQPPQSSYNLWWDLPTGAWSDGSQETL